MARSSAAGSYDDGVPSVLPKAEAPGGYQNVPARADAFGTGVAQGLEQAGAGIVKAAEIFEQVATDDAVNQWRTGARQLLDGDPNRTVIGADGQPGPDTGFLGLKGRAALDKRAETEAALNDLKQHIASSLNPVQRHHFESRVAEYKLHERVAAHARSEADRYAAQVNKTAGDLALDDIAGNASDPEAVERGFQALMRARVRNAQIAGGGPELLQAAERSAREDAIAARIRGLEPTAPDQALALLEQNRSLLAGRGDYVALSHRLRTRVDSEGGQALADRVRGGAGPQRQGAANTQGDEAGSRIAATLRQRGWSEAAIVGALNNAITESDLNPATKGAAGEEGFFQFHPQSHLPAFRRAYRGDMSPEAQAHYLADVVDKTMPGYAQSGDSAGATARFMREFERPKDQSDEALNRRGGNTNRAQAILGRLGAEGGPPEIVDKTGDAGFGARFGQLQNVKAMIVHHTAGGQSVDDVIGTFKERGYPAQFVIDRQGRVYRTLPDGAQGRHIIAGSGPKGEGLSNANTLGVEIIAKNDADVLPVQQQAATRLISALAQRYGFDPRTAVFGHGEVNPGHREDSEGMSTVSRLRGGAVRMAAAAGTPPDLEAQLREIEADPSASQRQKDIAAGIVSRDYHRQRAAQATAQRREAAAVKALMRDDEASIAATGEPVPELTPERVAAALGPEAADEFAANRTTAANFFQQTHDFPELPQAEIDGRLAAMRPVPGQLGYARSLKAFKAATNRADDLAKLRATDPAAAVSALPDVQEAARGASLARPEMFLPLVKARVAAMDRLGIPEENRVPVTRREAAALWQPIGLASRGGNPSEIKAALTGAVQRVQAAFGEHAQTALEAVLREGHADRETAGLAAAVVRRLARNETPTPAEARALDDAEANAAAAAAVTPLMTDPLSGAIMLPPGAPPIPNASPAPPGKRHPAPDAAAIEMLRRSPDTAAEFDAVYGPGAADKVLKIAPARGAK